MTYEKKRKKTRFNGKRCFLIVLSAYFLIAIIGQQSKINALSTEIKQTSQMIDSKQKEIAELEDKDKIYSQNDEIERIARDRLGLVRSDETVFVDITGK